MKTYFVSFLLLLIQFSCSQPSDAEKAAAPQEMEAQGIVMPQESLKPPQVISLATMPPPLTVEVPTQAGGFYMTKINNQETRIDLLPPETKPAGVFYSMQNYTSSDGLALDSTRSGIVDKTGNLWIGTNGGGVSRYDGKSFTNYTTAEGLIQNDVWSILEDKKGNLWFGTEGGVSKYDGKSFTTYTTAQGLADNLIKSILEDKTGNLWFGTNGGVSKYDGKSFITYMVAHGLAHNHILCIIEDKKGNLWFGTAGGVSKYDGKSFITYTTAEGLADNNVQTILEDKKGNLWFGTEKGGVSEYDGKSFTTYAEKQGLVNNTIWSILEDKKGNLWFGTEGGVSEYDGKSFTTYTTAEGLANNNVRAILEDKKENLWFGTFTGGVSCYGGKAFTNYTTAQGLPAILVRSILEDETGSLWISTQGGGVSKYDGKSFTTYTRSQGLADNTLRCSLEDKMGNLWFGSYGGGVSKYDGKSFTTYTKEQGLPDNFIRYILEDKMENLWFGTAEGGVSKYDGKTFTIYTTAQGLANNTIWNILEDKMGNLWFGTFGGGVSKYDGKSFITYTTEQGLASNFIMSSLEDEMGNLWFGTDGGGMSRYDGKSFTTYTAEQGLPDNVGYQITVTQDKNIVFGTNEGIAILTGYAPLLSQRTKASREHVIPPQNNLTNEELKSYKPVFEIYNSKKGYPIKDENGGENSMFLDSKGILWIGTGSAKTGLVRIDFSAINKNNNPLDVFIQSVKINNQSVVWNDLINKKFGTQSSKTENGGITTSPNLTEEVITLGRPLSDAERDAMRVNFGEIKFDKLTKFYYVPENLVLPHRLNNITFDFAALELVRPQDVLYQYKLEGYDKEWSPPTNDTKATFGNIFEGTYPFKVKAQSPAGIWSEPLTYTFKVLPPWYRTWWAYLLYGTSSTTGLVLIFRWRTAVLRRKLEHEEYLYHAAERFVPKPFLQLLHKEHLEDVQLGDSVKLPVSAMFADIRSFTTLAESLTPEQTASFLNTYTRYMVPVIRKNKGFVSQFLGDGILALFPETSSDAIDSALAMAEILPSFNKEMEEKGFTAISVGIGINMGDSILLALGEEERLEASVISDAINTASRVEGLNKFYKTELLITESVYKGLASPEKYLIRLIDKVILKGKTGGTGIYEVKPLPAGEVLESERLYYALYAEAFAFYEKGDFTKAEAAFKSCLEKKPDDTVVKLQMERCIEFQKSGTPEGWDGTYTLREK